MDVSNMKLLRKGLDVTVTGYTVLGYG